jgi:palmitoyl transferase
MYIQKNQNMKYWFIAFLLSISTSSFGEESTKSSLWSDIQGSLSQTWQSKNYELFIPVNTWHNRNYYTDKEIESYNEQPWGLGISKYRVDMAGNRHSLYVMAFLDSNNKVEPIVGYGYQKIWKAANDIRIGLGYTVGLTLRAESSYVLPIPILAPILSVGYKGLGMQSTYIFGGEAGGNVLFTWLSWQFD